MIEFLISIATLVAATALWALLYHITANPKAGWHSEEERQAGLKQHPEWRDPDEIDD